MSKRDSDLRIRPGRIRSSPSAGSKNVIDQVIRAARKAGHTGSFTAGTRSFAYGRSTFGRGRAAFGRSRLFGSNRRVVVKARIARHAGKAFRSAPLTAHLSYLKREGVNRDGERGVLFDADNDRADDRAFAARCEGDRHHFRFIVSPEDAAGMEDLKAFTRDLAKQMEADLGTKLDWVAVDHWNTDNPHVHLLVRGVDQTGADLVISRDYISRGLRSHAEDLVQIELGPKLEHEVRNTLEKEITAERWTRLDGEIRYHADDVGLIDLRPEQTGPGDPDIRRLMVGRLQHLETMGLATAAGPGEWMVGLDAEQRLRDLGMRGDIIKTMHRAFTERGQDRGLADYAIDGGGAGSTIIGRLVDRGLHNELTGEAYAVIDGTDGRAHHVRFRGIEAFEIAPAAGGIVEVRRFGQADDPRPTLVLATRSDLDLAAQVTAPGATWLDHRLVERERMPLSTGGFGGEARDAMQARAEHLAGQGLARRDGPRILLQRDLIATLRQRELDAVGERLAAETGLPYVKAAAGAPVSGKLGQAQAIAPAVPDYRPTDPQVAFYLARFIEQVRSVPADPIVLRQNWLRAYDLASDKGALALSDYARANDPFARVRKVQVSVEVSSVIRASPDSFRIAWTERRYQDGALAATERWSAILTVAVQTPRDADTLRKNPLGLYVTAIDWSKELGQ